MQLRSGTSNTHLLFISHPFPKLTQQRLLLHSARLHLPMHMIIVAHSLAAVVPHFAG